MKQFLLIVNVLMWGSMSVADICSHLPGYMVHGTSCFKFYSVKKNWAAAEASCVADGGHLASIHSSQEQAFVSGLMSLPTWIGLTGTPPTMAWSDGTDVDYENWQGTEPNDPGASCTKIRSGNKRGWEDMPCSRDKEYICRNDKVVDQSQAFFTKIPDGVPMEADVVSSSSQTVVSVIDCALRCQQDAQSVHFIMSDDGGNYLCETYTTLMRPPTVTPPTNNYQKIV